jgi:hypothetical protein
VIVTDATVTLVGVVNKVCIFVAFEKEYLVTVNTCQSADWRAYTALTCKHAEQAAHQVENGFNRMLATKICLPNTHAIAQTNGL